MSYTKNALNSVLVFLVFSFCGQSSANSEEEWSWSYQWQDTVNGIVSGQGTATSYDEAKGQLLGQCGQACGRLKTEYRGQTGERRTYALFLDPQDVSANFTEWVITYPDPAQEQEILDLYAISGGCPGPTDIRFKGDWVGSQISQIKTKVFTAYFGSECVANTVGLSSLQREREIYCDSPGYTPIVGQTESESICRGQVDGGISGIGTACSCTQDLVDGQCVARDIQFETAVSGSQKGSFIQRTDENNEGLACGRVATSNSCPAEASIANTGVKGNPIHCADGQKRQHEVDYQAPLGPLNLSRTYLNKPRSDDNRPPMVRIISNESNLANTQFIGYYKVDDPSWRINIPRLVSLGGGLKAVQIGNGTRYLFYRGTPGLSHFGTLETNAEGSLYTSRSGTQYQFDLSGRIARKTLRGGQFVDYNFASDTETILVDNFGRQLRLEHGERPFQGHNAIGPIYSMTDPDGKVTGFSYDGDGMITTVSYPGTQALKHYHYEGEDEDIRLVQITDELNVPYASWQYDDFSRATVSTHHNNAERVEVDYGETDWVEKTFSSLTREYRDDAQALETEYLFQAINGVRKPLRVSERPCLDCAPATTEYSYDTRGFLSNTSVLGGQEINYTYSTDGLLTNKTVAPGTSNAHSTGIAWHSDYSVPIRVTTPERRTHYDYDENGNVLSVASDPYGVNRKTEYSYNAAGQVLSIDGPRTDVSDITLFEYSVNGNLLRVTNALNHVTEINEHDAYGRPTEIADPNGVISELSYHPRGWLLSSSINGDVTQYSYNDVGLMTQLTMANGVTLTYEYDTARRLARIKDGLGNAIDYHVDHYGNRTRTELSDPNGVVRSYVDQAFNNLGQLISNTGANNQQQRWTYDVNGNIVSATDALDHSSSSQFDELNRVTQQIDPEQYASQFEYDRYQQISKVIDATGKETTYKRNTYGEVTEQVSPDTGKQTFTYDKAGNMLTAKDARGVVKTYSYDALNRVSSISFSDSAENITYTYDDTGQSHGIGRLSSVTDESGETRYGYDAKGQVISQTRLINGITFVTRYEYDQAGLLTAIVHPGGRRISYQRNTAGQIVQVLDDNQAIASSMHYLPFGPLRSLSYGNGLNLQRGYDQDYRLQSNEVTSVVGLTYQFTARNNISAITDQLNYNDDQQFSYDKLQRLINADGPSGPSAHTHDAIGNRLTELTQPPLKNYTYSDASHQLTMLADHSDGTGDPVATQQFAIEALSHSTMPYSTPDGTQALYSCAPGLRVSTVRGTGVYTSYSPICTAAAHHGLLDLAQGGLVLIESMGAQDGFQASTNNGITSYSAAAYPKSFRVVSVSQDYTNVVVTKPNPWSLNANAYRNRTDEEFIFGCPPDETSNTGVWGTGFYSYNSGICRSAAHAGVIDRTVGGELVLTMEPGLGGYRGSTQNGITSLDRTSASDSFSVRAVDEQPGTLHYYYDAAGNTIKSGNLRLSYDQLGRVKTASKPGMQASYTYDVNHLRASKTVNGVTTLYFYDLSGNLIAESDELGNIQREYVYSDGMRLAMIDNGQRYYIHSNHLDAPIALTDDSGAIQWQASVAPYGEMDIAIENVTMNFRFPGQYYDQETGLHYNWHRYYDPEIGSYLTSDPIGLSDGPNTYAYVGANPVNRTDSTGLFVDSVTNSCIRNPALCAIIGGATLDGGINVAGQVYEKGWSCVDWGEAGGSALEGAALGLAGYGVGLGIAKYGSGLLTGLGRGFGGLADDVSEIPTKFYKPNGGSDASDFISTHSQKHLYDATRTSRKNRSQFGEDVNVRELVNDTISNPDNAYSDINSKITKYSKSYDFNISTKHSPTGEMRVFINNARPDRSTQFPYVPRN